MQSKNEIIVKTSNDIIAGNGRILKIYVYFFYVGPPKEDIFSGYLLNPIFQSTFYTLHLLKDSFWILFRA